MSSLLIGLLSVDRQLSECSCAAGDPHVSLAYGGHADFRGSDNQFFNFLSDSGMSVNALTQSSLFTLGETIVNGTFINRIGLVAKSHIDDHLFKLDVDVNRLNSESWNFDLATGDCSGDKVTLGLHGKKICGDIEASVDYSTLTITTPEWKVTVGAQPVYNRLSGPSNRLDLTFAALKLDPEHPPHGIVGQSFDGTGVPRFGRIDTYPPRDEKSEFTTYAMAEGAIQGVPADYKVKSPYSTEFKFSKYDNDATEGSAPEKQVEALVGTLESATQGRDLSDTCTCDVGVDSESPPPPSPPPAGGFFFPDITIINQGDATAA